MTILSNNGAGGTAGVTATVANSGGGSGTAFSGKFTGGQGNTITYVTSGVLGKAYRFTQPGAGNGNGGWWWDFAGDDPAFRMSFEFTPGPVPTTPSALVAMYTSFPSTSAGRLYITSAGKLALFNSAGTAIWTSANALPATGRIDVALVAIPGTTTSNGTLKAAYWTEASGFNGAPAEQSPNSGNSAYGAVNAATGQVTQNRWGHELNSTWQNDFQATNFYLDTASGGAFPPMYVQAANQPPTVAALPTLIGTPGNATTFTAAATDNDGTIASYAWTVTALDGAPYTVTNGLTNPTLVITPGAHSAGARYDIGLTVVDDKVASSSTVVGKLLVRGTVVRVIAETANPGGWQASGLANTAANRVAAVTDGLDGTADQAPTAPSANAETRQRLAPLVASSAWSATLRHRLSAAASGIAGVALYEGNTQRAFWSVSTLQAPTTTAQTLTLTGSNVTSGSLTAVTNWDELDLAYIWGP